MSQFSIADILFKVCSEDPYIYNKFNDFSIHTDEDPDITLQVNGSEKIQRPEGDILLRDSLQWVRSFDGDKTYVYIRNNNQEIVSLMDLDKDWKTAKITYLKSGLEREGAVIEPLSEVLFRNQILLRQGIVIHASAIEYDGKGIVFTAPSETGKTTQSNLWVQYKGARILNGDRPAIKMHQGKPYVYGTPWSGSSPNYINTRAPIAMIVILEQAPLNSILELSKQEAVARLMPRCFLPYFNADLMEIAVSVIEKIITETPVYLLRCRPDQEAVELVYQCMK